ncbi:hypothetical protein BZG36_00934 [Bifiguratus adelaidae]|uniref:EXPERA domain-containing protein n=1 Tax=Bifiguratus adelaidae TaxID=1938954 RepID=A0A261Y5H7_9FUNG|nr:hypothetical protein BZG36_00934 [Bifiguratus adelaidae]
METVPIWIKGWFAISTILVVWDIFYCLLRPRSMLGGDLHWIWAPYNLYGKVDHGYGWPAFNRGDGFTSAQAWMNLVESIMNVGYLYLLEKPSVSIGQANLLAFAAVVMTLAKTVLYFLNDYCAGWRNSGHNDLYTWVTLYLVPNGMWILVPSILVIYFANDLVRRLSRTSKKVD